MIFSPLRSPMRSPLEPAVGRSYGPSIEAAAIAAATRNGAALWYVPQDLSGVWQNNNATGAPAVSSQVGYVADRAGTTHITQATGTLRPTLVVLANGRYALQFDGTDDVLATAATTTGSTGTYIAAAAPAAVLARNVLGNGGTAAGTAGSSIGFASGGALRFSRSDGVTNTPLLSGGSYSATTPVVIAATWNGTAGVLRVAGVQVGSAAGPTASGAGFVAVGAANASGVAPFGGPVSLACYAPVVMPDADIIAIERFAASLSGASY